MARYSLENAKKFRWSSVSGVLHPERVSHLETYLCGKKVLDAGCGGGGYAHSLEQKGFDVTGLDRYYEFLQAAHSNQREGAYILGDVVSLPFPNKIFDCTYCFDVLEHVDDEMAIEELARVTQRRLILTVPKEDVVMHQFGLTFFHYQDQTHLRYYTEMALDHLLSKVNYSRAFFFPELAIPSKELFLALSQSGKSRFLGRVYYHLIKRFLNEDSFGKIYTGLVAVVDLER